MNSVFWGVGAFLIANAAFLRGCFVFFRRGKPLYFQLLVCAAGCCGLAALSAVVNTLCGAVQEGFHISLLGLLGCCFFLLSANYGQMDGVVDDGSADNRKARWLALLAPGVLAGALVLLLVRGTVPVYTAVFCLSALPAAYYNLKHLLLPVDELGFLRATRLCNGCSLLFCGWSLLCPAALTGPFSVVTALLTAGLVFACERGMSLWPTLL